MKRKSSEAADRRADSRTATAGDTPVWLHEEGHGVLILVHLQPGARRTSLCGEHAGRLKIAVAAPPLEGRANEALVEWLARRLDLPRRKVQLVAGQRSRDKTLRVEGVNASRALRLLAQE